MHELQLHSICREKNIGGVGTSPPPLLQVRLLRYCSDLQDVPIQAREIDMDICRIGGSFIHFRGTLPIF